MHNPFKHLFVVAAVVGVLSANVFAATTIVYSNNPAPGDDVTSGSAAVGTSGWIYNNVRYDGHVGIRTDLPRSGNGSVWFKGEQGPSGNSSKADIEYWSRTPLGTLNDLNLLSYEWYRKSGSYTAHAHYHPVLRIWLSNGDGAYGFDGSSKGYLVFERAYNAPWYTSAVPTNTWVGDSITDSTVLWSTGSLPDAFGVYNRTLSQWKSLIGNYKVYAISAGIGSGWGTFEGAVDNISYQFGNGPVVTTNFEVVPEPTTMALFGLGLLGAAGGLLRRKPA
jgi:hypothetical protein